MSAETLTINLPEDIAVRLSALPAREQERVREEIGAFAVALVRGKATEVRFSRKELWAMPREEREVIMRAQAADAAPLYEADLARSAEERELTAFESLNDFDPILEPEAYLGGQPEAR